MRIFRLPNGMAVTSGGKLLRPSQIAELELRDKAIVDLSLASDVQPIVIERIVGTRTTPQIRHLFHEVAAGRMKFDINTRSFKPRSQK